MSRIQKAAPSFKQALLPNKDPTPGSRYPIVSLAGLVARDQWGDCRYHEKVNQLRGFESFSRPA
jgi:hypothetical protein